MTQQPDSILVLIAALPFVGALFPGLMIRAGRNACAVTAGAATLSALILLLIEAGPVLRGEVITYQLNWVPLLNLNANFMLDGLGLLFAGMILGIGLLIIIYARFYLSREDPMGKFYTYLMLFQGAMLGIVLSDNILLLLVFWELTSLSSFLLIGYWNHLPEGRQGARMALTVTGLGGLAAIGGALILGNIAGSYDLSVILTKREIIQASPLYVPALLLILGGAFTKSAQFPFHFWLPHAMAAPTPVSAYLHSATMVKAGLFLMARLWPVLAGTEIWFYIVATTGLLTMLIGAYIALFKDDLKAILAFSTVSHLGLVTMLLGFGTEAAAVAAVLHIINHSTFKAALFMCAGIVDHEAHTRNIRKLGGLASLMPITATLTMVAGMSMAGIPLFNGFYSKELMLEEASKSIWVNSPWTIPVLATIAALLSVAYSFRLMFHTFGGPTRDDYPAHPHDPPFGMWVSPAILVLLAIAIGLMPNLMLSGLLGAAADAVTGHHVHLHKIKLWHGVTWALIMSGIAIAGGLVMVFFYQPIHRLWAKMPHPDAKSIFDAIVGAAVFAGRSFTNWTHAGRLTDYLSTFLFATLCVGGLAFLSGDYAPGTRPMLEVPIEVTVGWVLLVASSLTLVATYRNRFMNLVILGVVGLMVSLAFVYLSAPDLAMTQVSVEVVTIILLLLALYFLPKHIVTPHPTWKWIRDIGLSLGCGGAVTLLSYAIMTRDFETISGFHLENAKPGGGGTNVVNVILVDFRGYDTFGEIIVLGIAALTIYAIGNALLGGEASRRLANWTFDSPKSQDRHPMMMVVATRVMMPIAIMVAVYIFLRGHNQPGGGFVAGLIVAIAVLMQYMASGFAWAQERQPMPYHSMIGLGVLVAAITGIGSWFAGQPFLTSAFGYVHIPPIEEFELASAMGFDLGVFLTVVGAVMLALYSLSGLARRAGEQVNVGAMDYDPSAAAEADDDAETEDDDHDFEPVPIPQEPKPEKL